VGRLGWVTAGSIRAALEEVAGRKRPEILETDLGAFAAGLEAGKAVLAS
jgi:hypothetical protein